MILINRLWGKNINTYFILILRHIFKFSLRVHVRRGLKVLEEAKLIHFQDYMVHVRDFYEKYFFKFPQNKGKLKKNVYLVTEDLNVLDELKK